MTIVIPNGEFSGDIKELEEKIRTLIGRSENRVKHGATKTIRAYLCKVCGNEGIRTNIRNHIGGLAR